MTQEHRLIAALKQVKHELLIPAAEYVPAIPACWEIIDAALAAPTPVGSLGSSADADTHRAAEKAVLVLKEIIPAVEAYLMTGDVMARAIKKNTWGPVLKRAYAVTGDGQ